MEQEKILEARAVWRVFEGTKTPVEVLKGLDLSVSAGEVVVVIGASGAGKSTLLHILGTLDAPDKGSVHIRGVDPRNCSPRELDLLRNRDLGFVFQFHYLLPEFNALENVLLPYRIFHGRLVPDVVARAKRLIERVGVGPHMLNRANDLSGGEQQRIAIARSLINQPRLILADEPTGNLDHESSEEVKSLLREINKESKTTFLIVTHDRHIAAGCDRIIEIDDGQVKNDFNASEFGEDEKWQKLAPSTCREKIRLA